jgi:hypothetical protein
MMAILAQLAVQKKSAITMIAMANKVRQKHTFMIYPSFMKILVIYIFYIGIDVKGIIRGVIAG